MRDSRLLFSVLAAGLLLNASAQHAVLQVGSEWIAQGDFDGDGNTDVALLSPEAGTYRILYQDGPTLTSSTTRFLGTPDIQGLTVGRIGQTLRDRLVISSPSLNRLQLLDDASRTGATVFEGMQLTGIGPTQAVALEEITPSLSAEEDLLVLTSWNTLGEQLERIDGDTGSLLQAATPAETYLHGQRMFLKSGNPERAAFLLRAGDLSESIRVLDANKPVPEKLLDLPLPTTGNRFQTAILPPQAVTRVLVWKHRGNDLLLYNLQPALPVGYESAGFTVFNFPGKEIHGVQVVETNPSRFLFLFGEGVPAELHEFDGVDDLTLLATYPVPFNGTFSGAAALENGTFALFSRTLGEPASDQVRIVDLTTAPYKVLQTLALPDQPVSRGSNLFVYSGEPFVADDAVQLYSSQAPDWSTDGSIVANQLRADRVLDGGAETGLGTLPEDIPMGAWTDGGDVLYNQWENDIAIYSFATGMGTRTVDAQVVPDGGSFDQTVEVQFQGLPEGTDVWARTVPDGPWLTVNDPFYLARTTTYQYFAMNGSGERGPVRTVTYTFPSPDEMDSDGDGIPDYVELANGLDPFGGLDQDEDGWTDLDELFLGTFGNDPASTPPDESPRTTTLSRYALEVNPYAHNQSGTVESVFQPGLPLSLYTLGGGRIGSASTTVGNPRLPGEDALALFEDIPQGPSFEILSLSTPSSFPVLGDVVDDLNPAAVSGRELLGLILPETTGSLTVPYAHGGGDDAFESNVWILTASGFYTGLDPVVQSEQLNRYDTLVALILEYVAGLELGDRGVVPSNLITLFPHRDEGSDRNPISLEMLRSLRQPGPSDEPAKDPFLYLQALQTAIDGGAGNIEQLKILTDEIYRISTTLANGSPGEFPPPVDVIRTYLTDRTLPASYATKVDMWPLELADASQAVTDLAAAFVERSFVDGMALYVPETETSGSCSILHTGTGTPVALVNADGDPFPFPLAFDLEPGMQFLVSGYNDVSSGCAAQTLEVTQLILVDVILATGTDTDGNLLPDDMERFLFGTTGEPHDGDRDGDGYSDLQEILDGTDPRDGQSNSGSGPVSLSLPTLSLVTDDTEKVEWEWPQGYQSFFQFTLEETDILTDGFEAVGGILSTDGSTMQIALPETGERDIAFFRIGISLR